MSVPRFTVEYLKEHFNSLSYDEKIEVKHAGKPKPEINLTQTTKGKTGDFNRKFKTEIYEKNDWICGCSTTNRFFLFSLFVIWTWNCLTRMDKNWNSRSWSPSAKNKKT